MAFLVQEDLVRTVPNESMTFINCVNTVLLRWMVPLGDGVKPACRVFTMLVMKRQRKWCSKIAKTRDKSKSNDYTAGIVARIGSGTSQYIAAKITDTSNDGVGAGFVPPGL